MFCREPEREGGSGCKSAASSVVGQDGAQARKEQTGICLLVCASVAFAAVIEDWSSHPCPSAGLCTSVCVLKEMEAGGVLVDKVEG